MKLSDFWTDLPHALCDISKEILTQEETSISHIIVNTSKVINFLSKKIDAKYLKQKYKIKLIYSFKSIY